MTERKTEEFNSFNLIQFIWKWRIWFIISCLAAGILTYVTCLLINPYFESTAIVYAPRTNSVSQILFPTGDNYNERLDMKAYGIEEETEQMMQVLNSDDLRDIIVTKFDLMPHYGVDSTVSGWRYKLNKIYTSNVKINRTSYGAIAIKVIDVDANLAATIANEIVNQLDTLKNRIERQRAEAAYLLLQNQLVEINAEIDRTNDSLEMMMQLGVFDFERQSDRLMQQHAVAVAQGNAAAMKRLEEEMTKLATWGPKVENLREQLQHFREYQVLCKTQLMNAKIDMEGQIPVKFTLQKAQPGDKIVYPKKLVMTIVAVVSTFIILLIVLLIVDNIRRMPRAERKGEQPQN